MADGQAGKLTRRRLFRRLAAAPLAGIAAATGLTATRTYMARNFAQNGVWGAGLADSWAPFFKKHGISCISTPWHPERFI